MFERGGREEGGKRGKLLGNWRRRLAMKIWVLMREKQRLTGGKWRGDGCMNGGGYPRVYSQAKYAG